MKEIKIASSEDVIKSGRGKYFPVFFFAFMGLSPYNLLWLRDTFEIVSRIILYQLIRDTQIILKENLSKRDMF